MRHLLVALLLAGCNQAALGTGSDGGVDLRAVDLAAADLTGRPVDLAGFCGDPSSPRVDFNSFVANSPSVMARLDALNCCDAAELDVISMQIPQSLVLWWRHQVGQGPNPPLTLDLANLPAGWSVTLQTGCGPLDPGCQPTDRYDSGLEGSLTIAGNGAAYQMSACVSAAEPAATPHPVLHSARLWAPTITTQ
jgi:hypothetical protein